MKKYFLIILILIVTACAPVELTPSVGAIQTAIAETELAMPKLTNTPIVATATEGIVPSAIPAPSSTPLASVSIFGSINVAFLNLRSGPSTLFDVLGTFPENTPVEILGKIENSDWTEVKITQEDESIITGWMSGDLIKIESDFNEIRVLDYTEAEYISGKINLISGDPIDNVSVTITHRINDVETRHYTPSNENGIFIAYYPEDMIGLFDVQITGILCESSILDENCQLTDYFKFESRSFIEIPQTEEIQFFYEAATGVLSGSVVDSLGDPVPDFVVTAERDDGAESSNRTDSEGNFSIPIGEGIWEVYALVVFPRNEGERLTVNITDSPPPAIELISPE